MCFAALIERRGGGERLGDFGDARGLEVGLAAEDGGEGGGEVAAGVGVVGQAEVHEQRTEIGVAEAERAVVVRVAGDALRGVAGVVDEDLHGGEHDVDGIAIGLDVKGACRGDELHQVEAGEVAGGVVEEHVLRAGIGRVDAAGVLRGVPAVDGGVVLHAGIAALPGGFGDLVHEVAGFVGLDGGAVLDGAGGEFGVLLPRVHELIVDADGVVGVLEEDGREGFGVGAGAIVASGDEGVGLGFLFGFALDEVDDVGMVDVEDDHLGGAAGFAAGLDDAGEGVKAAHEAQGAGSGATAGEEFRRAADGREIRARA